MDKKVTQISIQTATNGAAFRLVFMAEDGTGIPVVLSPDMLRDAISALIEASAAVPAPLIRSFTTDVPLNETPIRASAIGVSPIPSEPMNARLTVLCGIVDLQFSIPLDDLFGILRTLEDESEPGPNSSLSS